MDHYLADLRGLLARLEFTGLVEFRPGFRGRPAISHVLFDFDGTISLIRQGWPEVMVPMFVEMLPALPGESPADVERLAIDDIMRLNEYLRRLDVRIRDRVQGLQAGRLSPDDLLVFGSRRLLENLRARGLTLYLASGTDEPFVRQEAELLDVARYLYPEDKFADYEAPEETIPDSPGFYKEWILAAKGETDVPPTCNFDYSGPLTETVLLGNVAYRSQSRFEWDAEKLVAKGSSDEIAGLIRETYRKGWEVS